jgi:hypothetical protein
MTNFIRAKYWHGEAYHYDVLCEDCRYHPDTAPEYVGCLMKPLQNGDTDPRDGEPWTCCICGTVDETNLEPNDINAEPYWELL